VDVDVKNGANLLDRLVKDIVTESESFDVDKFIPLLQKYIRMTNPYIRQLMVIFLCQLVLAIIVRLQICQGWLDHRA
jgi:hypothetical protein